MLLPVKLRFVFELAHARVKSGKLDIAPRRACRAARGGMLLATRTHGSARDIAVKRSR
jgi:hypothetical protein